MQWLRRETPGDSLTIVLTSPDRPLRSEASTGGMDLAVWGEELKTLEPSSQGGNFPATFAAIRSVLEGRKSSSANVYVISDFQRIDWTPSRGEAQKADAATRGHGVAATAGGRDGDSKKPPGREWLAARAAGGMGRRRRRSARASHCVHGCGRCDSAQPDCCGHRAAAGPGHRRGHWQLLGSNHQQRRQRVGSDIHAGVCRRRGAAGRCRSCDPAEPERGGSVRSDLSERRRGNPHHRATAGRAPRR